jgi:hypothetical protein
MPLEGEQNAVTDADGAEDTPTRQGSHLAGRQAFRGGVENVVVMKEQWVHVCLSF